MIGQAKRDQVLYREVQTAYGHAPVPRLYLMREIYVADSDARARAGVTPISRSSGWFEPGKAWRRRDD
jgi:hypothetical protein